MSFRETRTPVLRTDGLGQAGDTYVLLEEARLRCEQLTAQAATDREWELLRAIHRELGMAGWLASAEIDSHQRLWLLATARRRSQLQVWDVDATHALVAAAILAEDTIAETTGDMSDDLHLAHLHLLRAEELLHDHLPSAPA